MTPESDAVTSREPRKRPWKARWFSPHWAEFIGSSYATEERAVARARAEVAEGCFAATVWKQDGDYLVPGTSRKVTSEPTDA